MGRSASLASRCTGDCQHECGRYTRRMSVTPQFLSAIIAHVPRAPHTTVHTHTTPDHTHTAHRPQPSHRRAHAANHRCTQTTPHRHSTRRQSTAETSLTASRNQPHTSGTATYAVDTDARLIVILSSIPYLRCDSIHLTQRGLPTTAPNWVGRSRAGALARGDLPRTARARGPAVGVRSARSRHGTRASLEPPASSHGRALPAASF